MAETWDEEKPAGSRKPSLGDDDIREFKRALRERLAEDHQFEAAEDPAFGAVGGYQIGKHNFVTLLEQASDKVTLENEVAIEAKDLSGSPEVYLIPENDGTPLLITRENVSKLNAITANNGTHDIAFPTNNMAAAIYMLGNSDTVIWLRVNSAPPGWKVLSDGGDGLIAVQGGSTYTVVGSSKKGNWTISMNSHRHQWYNQQPASNNEVYNSSGQAVDISTIHDDSSNDVILSETSGLGLNADLFTKNETATAQTYRPEASVGRLYQLDTP